LDRFIQAERLNTKMLCGFLSALAGEKSRVSRKGAEALRKPEGFSAAIFLFLKLLQILL
jgi:hypothetical protein